MNEHSKPKFFPFIMEPKMDGMEVVKDVEAFFGRGQKTKKEPKLHSNDAEASKLLDDIVAAIRSYVVMSEASYTATALWVLFTHTVEVSYIATYLGIITPEAGCGKSTLEDVFDRLVKNPVKADDISPSALFRMVDEDQPTLLIDEADAFFQGERKELKSIFNSGHRRGGKVYRSKEEKTAKGTDWKPKGYDVFGPKAIAGIGDHWMWDALKTRCILIYLKMKLESETAKEPEELLTDENLPILKQRIEDWARNNLEPLKEIKVDIPKELQNRTKDNWKPLLKIARIISNEWYNKACSAAFEIEGINRKQAKELSLGQQLLFDCRVVFNVEDNKTKEYLSAEELIFGLSLIEESDWGTRNYGKPITPNWFAKQLRQYGVHSVKCSAGADRGKMVWYRHMFEDAWTRYLSFLEVSTSSVSSTEQPKAKQFSWSRPAAWFDTIEEGMEIRVLMRDDQEVDYHDYVECPDGGWRTLDEINAWNEMNPDKQISFEYDGVMM